MQKNNIFIFNQLAIRSALAKTLSCCLAFFLAIALRTEHPFWALISAFVIPYANIGSTLTTAFKRIFATILGVGLGMVIIILFATYKLVFIIVVFLTVTILMNFHYKYNSYIFLMSSITFVLLVVTVFIAPDKIITTAFFRCLEITIGVLSDSLVTILLFPNLVSKKIRGMEKEIIPEFFNLAIKGFKKDKDFLLGKNNLLEKINNIIKARTDAKIENILPWQRNNHSFDVELEFSIVIKLIENYYSSNYKAINLTTILKDAEQTCLALNNNEITLTMYNEKILSLAEEITERKVKVIIKALFISTEIDSSFCQPITPTPVSKYLELVNFRQGIKAALSVLCLPFIWIAFNLPGLGQVGISAVILMKMDENNAKETAWKRTLGCITGVVIGLFLVGLGITNFALYISVFAIITFIIALLFYSDNQKSYIYLQVFVAMAVTIVTNEEPVMTMSSGLQRASGVILGVISASVINYLLWPISANKFFRMKLAEVQQNLLMIIRNIEKEPDYLNINQLHQFHQELVKLRNTKVINAQFNDRIKEPLYQSLQLVFNNLYVIQTNRELLSKEQKEILPTLLKKLELLLVEINFTKDSIITFPASYKALFSEFPDNIELLSRTLVCINNSEMQQTTSSADIMLRGMGF
jgi:uncharacterized membrane protein YgaE (UPF0421/DUF939 family)